MFGYRTPAKTSLSRDPEPQNPRSPEGKHSNGAGPPEPMIETGSLTKVRRSIGEWETGKTGLKRTPPPNKPTSSKATMKTAAISMGIEMAKPKGRVAEAKACLIRAKLQINSSRNLKAEIKAEVILAIETLYRLVKEAEAAKPSPTPPPAGAPSEERPEGVDVQEALKGHARLVKESHDLTTEVMREIKLQRDEIAAVIQSVGAVKGEIVNIRENIEKNRVLDGVSYAEIAATSKKETANHTPIPQAVHSVVISSEDAHDTSEDVISKIRSAVSAKTTGIRVDRLRKAKDQRVVLGCQSREEMEKVLGKLKADSPTLTVKAVENKDPLVILFGVLCMNTDEEVLGALKKQNGHILGSIPERDYRVSVKFRRKARNPLENHVVLQVSPSVWQLLTSAGKVHIDLQRVAVKDQSPLMTCSRCLGYGHGRKTCPKTVDTCSHCAGSHLRSECPAWQAGKTPTCCNCQSARLDRTDHSSFDGTCPIRSKWDALARARVAYC